MRQQLRGADVRWVTALVLGLALVGCKGVEETDQPEEAGVSSELPPMSVGTAQAIGPHRHLARVVVAVEPGASTDPEEEQLEVVWLDLTRYSMSRHVDGRLKSLEIRDGDQAAQRLKSGRYKWRTPRPGPDVLLKTLSAFDTLIARFRSRLLVTPVELLPEDPDGWSRYTLSLAPLPVVAEGESAMERLERDILNDGHSALPLSLSGEVLVDEFGNRRQVNLEGSYRKRSGAGFESGAVAVTLEESRIALGPSEGLDIPTEVAVLFAERRGTEEEPSAAPSPGDEPTP